MAPFLSFLGNKRITEEPATLMLDLQAPLEETDGVAEALQTLLSKVQKTFQTLTFERLSGECHPSNLPQRSGNPGPSLRDRWSKP